MQTLHTPSVRSSLLARLSRLSPATPAKWGRFTAPRMLAHVNDNLRMALGDLRCAPKRGPLRYFPLNKLVIHLMPWPRGAPTAPELIARAPDEWDEEVRAFGALVERFSARAGDQPYPAHPAFGAISGKDWGALEFRHIDHHFTQFGA